ncbi:redox-sensitive transcriptional activator SoxR [Jatrophihabitans telluris]|uniref:Redox-sensitive transcriptional activator SoxR n=1 Tax=Jatrophihabitans telluris TaxID=2038343 RepID=A0ABY4R405_9ACTN|nr:redox-sensitive transcriptional activator SoxR [Jatrophihabitans telluris]UQX89836.1 redox-sensitive transcriptional activator SoxR [Jatrophihabitans telluris]
MPSEVLTVSEIAHRSGFAASALRYYEREGLIEASRTSGGQRRYQRSVLRRLAFIRAARNVGLSLQEVRVELAQLPAGRTPTKADWGRISRDWRHRLDEQITALEALRDGLQSCIGCGCLSLKACAMSNPADIAARYAPSGGAAYLPPLLRRPPEPEPGATP